MKKNDHGLIQRSDILPWEASASLWDQTLLTIRLQREWGGGELWLTNKPSFQLQPQRARPFQQLFWLLAISPGKKLPLRGCSFMLQALEIYVAQATCPCVQSRKHICISIYGGFFTNTEELKILKNGLVTLDLKMRCPSEEYSYLLQLPYAEKRSERIDIPG